MSKKTEKAIIERIKHIETFYEQPPPGTVQEYEDKPEDCIPDTEANQKARDFLASAPSKGLWMPLGKEVKVMQCWKCKNYGHRTGDKECPLFEKGNASIEKFREMYEDPMYSVLNSESRQKQDSKLRWLQQILDDSTTSDSSSDSKDEKRKKKKKKKSKKKWVEKSVSDESSDNGKKSKKHKTKKHKSSSSKDSEKRHSKDRKSSHKSSDNRKRTTSSDSDQQRKKRKKQKKADH